MFMDLRYLVQVLHAVRWQWCTEHVLGLLGTFGLIAPSVLPADGVADLRAPSGLLAQVKFTGGSPAGFQFLFLLPQVPDADDELASQYQELIAISLRAATGETGGRWSVGTSELSLSPIMTAGRRAVALSVEPQHRRAHA